MAILGAGNFANNTYAPILSEFGSSITVVAVWSRSETKSRLLAQNVKKYSPSIQTHYGDEGLEAVLSSDAVDAVVVVLPPRPALEITMRALRSGKHALQEKPIGSSQEEVRAAIEEYENMGQWRPIWGLAENYRFETVYSEACAAIKEKLGGGVIQINLSASLALSDKR